MADQVEVIRKLEEKVQQALLAKEDDITAALLNTYKTRLNILIKDLLWLNGPFLDSDDITRSRWRALQLDQQSLEMISTHLDGLNKQIATNLVEDLNQFGKDSYQLTSWAVDQGFPPTVDLRWNLPTNDVLKAFIAAPWKGQMFSDRIGHISDTMARQLQQALTDGIMSGDSTQDIARAMRKNVGIPEDAKLVTRPRASRTVYRALLVARSEAMRMTNSMRERIFSDNKSTMADRVWTAAPGFIRVCDECADRDGMTYDEIVDEYGQEDADRLLYGNCHPNGRCMYTLRPKPFQDLLPESLKAAGKGLYGDIAATEMKYVNPANPGKLVSMTVQPYDEWLEDQQ
jgi:hypothetical protein